MSTLDPRERFTGLAQTYARHRPSYPDALFDWILALFDETPPRTVADIGCGTGISTRLLAARGLDVVGVDPNEDMLAEARAEGGGARYVLGDAEATGLADASVDLVTAAQAFHWFDAPRAAVEFKRILSPGGWCAAWWNAPQGTPMQVEYRDAIRKWSGEYAAIPKTSHGIEKVRAIAGDRVIHEATFSIAQRLDEEGFLGRAHSASYVHVGVADRDAFDAALRDVFARHQREGFVEFPYDCRAFAWRAGTQKA